MGTKLSLDGADYLPYDKENPDTAVIYLTWKNAVVERDIMRPRWPQVHTITIPFPFKLKAVNLYLLKDVYRAHPDRRRSEHC
ncbi:MAG: hypothetical protein WCA08_13770 [Desulfoferrobacter sp.]